MKKINFSKAPSKMADLDPKSLSIVEINKHQLNILVGYNECPFCAEVEQIFKNYNIKYYYIQKHSNRTLESQIHDLYQHFTYPMVFVDGEWIGGCSELKAKIEEKPLRQRG